jgi:tetratricopeptide (TPR) repeat protein
MKHWRIYLILAGSLFLFSCSGTQIKAPESDRSIFKDGMSAYEAGDFQTAYDIFLTEAKRGNAEAQYNLGLMFAKGQRVFQDYNETANWFKKAAEQGYALAQYKLGLMYVDGKGVNHEFEQAIYWLERAINSDPKYPYTYNDLAWLLATYRNEKYRDGNKAVRLAKKAVELFPKGKHLDTLAAAYAEVGQFEDALETQGEAISILLKEGIPETKLSEYKERLTAYQANRPWRESRITANYKAVMDNLLGADINDVISMGYPHRTLMTANGNQVYLGSASYPHATFTAPNGNKVYAYNYGTAFKTPTIPDGQTACEVYGYDNKSAYYGGQTVGKWCTTFLETDVSGRIIQWRGDGNSCTQEAINWRLRHTMPKEMENRVDEVIYERLKDGWRDAGYSEAEIKRMLNAYRLRMERH